MSQGRSNRIRDWSTIRRILVKTMALFIICNVMFASCDPWPFLGTLSVYNNIVPGRHRLPYGDDPERSYNLTLDQLDVMVASHEIAGRPKSTQEFRVLVIGDSALWGFLLRADETLSAQINAGDFQTLDGRRIRVFNFGYPTMSLTKDLLLLERGLEFEPDLIVWFFTLEAFPREKQIEAPLVQANPVPTRDLIQEYQIDLDRQDPRFKPLSFWRRTIVGQRKVIADTLRLQLYGALWVSTAVDRHLPETYNRLAVDLSADPSFQSWAPGDLRRDHLAFEILSAGVSLAGETPVLLANEPMFISEGENSDVRYNFYYPRWAYDAYRVWLIEMSESEGWDLLDMWDWLPPDAFTDSAIHYDSEASRSMAAYIAEAIAERATMDVLTGE